MVITLWSKQASQNKLNKKSQRPSKNETQWKMAYFDEENVVQPKKMSTPAESVPCNCFCLDAHHTQINIGNNMR